MLTQVFQYQNQAITFSNEGDIMINATDMAKPFAKRPVDFTRLDQTQEFMKVLEAKVQIPTLTVMHGGSNPGTWMHQKLALKFAAWLSPEFELWVYDRIEELLTTGKVHLQPKTKEEIIAEGFQLALAEVAAVKEQLALANRTIQVQAPKVEYCDNVLQSNGTHPITIIAKELGMGPVTLNRKLKQMGVQRLVNGTWVLTAKYQGKGFTDTKTFPYYDSQNNLKTNIQTVWTEPGRQFIHQLLSAA